EPLIPSWVKIIFLILLFGTIYIAARFMLVWDKPYSDDATRVSITIEPGSSLQAIAKNLHERELIADAWVFQWFVKSKGLGNKLQAGEYILQRNLTFAEIAQRLQEGKSEEIRITIPEGSTIHQIDDILTKKNLIQAGDFIDCAATCVFSFHQSNFEGFLFPSTYFINPKSFSSKSFIQRLYNNWSVKINPLLADIEKAGRTTEEVVIVASMIEREAFGSDFSEKAQISDVIWKRYDEGIHLGIDATTRYELNEWKRPLYTEDFESQSPYNTRKTMGLPPTAISNPGELSLKAAVYPESTPYYYYLHDKNGKIRFAKDLEGHNENKRKYLW
ncbi:MAG TPA: endolytic transglycosylase MltG, partial [Candidatus Gracilibacteria bacterium]